MKVSRLDFFGVELPQCTRNNSATLRPGPSTVITKITFRGYKDQANFVSKDRGLTVATGIEKGR